MISLRWYTILGMPTLMLCIGLMILGAEQLWGHPAAAGSAAAMALFFAFGTLSAQGLVGEDTRSFSWATIRTEVIDYMFLTMMATCAASLLVCVYEVAPFVTTLTLFILFYVLFYAGHHFYRGLRGLAGSNLPLLGKDFVTSGFIAPMATVCFLLMRYYEIPKIGEYAFFLLAAFHLVAFWFQFRTQKTRKQFG
jgi:hypothetical protein